jgi:hypothetical protein
MEMRFYIAGADRAWCVAFALRDKRRARWAPGISALGVLGADNIYSERVVAQPQPSQQYNSTPAILLVGPGATSRRTVGWVAGVGLI